MKSLITATFVLACMTAVPVASQAQTPTGAPVQYALVVGANTGGDGQETLRFAETDASNVADVLQTLGRYDQSNVIRLAQPTPTELRAAIKRLSRLLKAHADAGQATSVLFYYSGHARASSLNLADAELELTTLRAELEALPATLTVVILDACQSGSFSRVKGVSGAADFSVNSVTNLNATGIVVMASSSASELSQESERLGSSYFTHYLIVALRGAGDDNADGRVTIDEAYRYAYNRTLAATAKTAVGKQHVTLETALRGKGEIALTYPRSMKSALLLPKLSTGDFLVQAAKSGSVLAEVTKVKDKAVRLALAPGVYRVVVRRGERAVECRQTVAPGRTTSFVERHCTEIVLEDTRSKGYHERRPWVIELGNGFGTARDDAFVARLRDFGYRGDENALPLHLDIGVYRHLSHHVWLGASAITLTTGDFDRTGDTERQSFGWSTLGFLGSLRYENAIAHYPSGDPALIPFVDVSAGLARASTTLTVGNNDDVRVDHGFAVSAAVGVQWMFIPGFGMFFKGRYAVAPTIDNLLGETHDTGGTFFTIGIRKTLGGR